MISTTFQTLLFDLDGTLTDSKEGILNCVRYALDHFNYTEKDYTDQFLNPFIGPPLTDSFRDFCGFSPADVDKAVVLYRERFSTIGLFENKAYPGIHHLLEGCKNAGKTLAVATSKPHPFTLRILERYELDSYFDIIVGSDDILLNTKTKVILEVLRQAKELDSSFDMQKTVMIGDRKHDIIGAKNACLFSIGANYGYADKGELAAAGADHIVASVKELEQYLLSH